MTTRTRGHTNRRSIAAALASLALAPALTGCGGDDTTAEPQATANPATAVAAQDDDAPPATVAAPTMESAVAPAAATETSGVPVAGSSATEAPVDADEVQGSAGECPSAEDVGAIVGASVTLNDDLSVHEPQFTTCWFQPDDPAVPGNVYIEIFPVPGVIVSEYEAEEIPGIGDSTWWQEEINTLTVWTDSLSISVAIHIAMSYDERVAASIAVVELVI